MILPSKQLNRDRALITIGADILHILSDAKTVSRVWDELRQVHQRRYGELLVTYDWFVLALDWLYTIDTIDLENGRLRRRIV